MIFLGPCFAKPQQTRRNCFCTELKCSAVGREHLPEKHTTVRDGKRLLWYTEGLWKKAEQLVPFDIETSAIKELDENCWFGSRPPTLREVLSHFERIQKADLAYPIILNHDGSLMDGGHRLCKAILEGRREIKAVQFSSMPTPDELSEIHNP